MKKVLFIAYAFPPVGGSGVQRSLKFVKYLRNFNWEPIVVTVDKSIYFPKDKSLTEEIPNNLKIIRIKDKSQNEYVETILAEIKQEFSPVLDVLDKWYKKFFIDIFKMNIRGIEPQLKIPDIQTLWAKNVLTTLEKNVDLNDIDLIYSTCDPFSNLLIAYNLNKKYNIPWVVDFRDEWSNGQFVTLDKNNVYFKIHKNLEYNVINQCDKIITVTSIAKENYINNFGVDSSKIEVITNGYDERDFECLEEYNYDKFLIVYNGSLYNPITPNIFLDSVNQLIDEGLIDREKISINFIGSCSNSIYNDIFSRNKHKVITYLGYIPHKESLKYVISANVLLVLLGKKDRMKEVYTGKVFEYLRAKKPILALSPKGSLVEKLLNKTSCGKNVEYNDVEGIKKFIYEQYKHWENSENAMIPNEKEIYKYDRKCLTEQLGKTFDELL